ncbi:hypothetical protein L226DRAFT_5385 [Lentinus tigrinus ALCF2SS1-7]|uniref:uncharacterized protein n=1 Tax=Lentinus tigrinus ALCF2SS1-7 TaxID=1328758 RepID=UPI0011661CB1|nr:hypothetical protein L226DRAFT_5385 [Lentinus tigrinus ALCF2SS1-7]
MQCLEILIDRIDDTKMLGGAWAGAEDERTPSMDAGREEEGEAAVGRALRLPYGRSSGSDCNVPLLRRRLPTVWSSLRPRSSYIRPLHAQTSCTYRQHIDPRQPRVVPESILAVLDLRERTSNLGSHLGHVGLCSLGAHVWSLRRVSIRLCQRRDNAQPDVPQAEG